MSSLNFVQRERLLLPLDENRVESRDGMSYLNVSDVRRWLIRIFGFGGWSYTVSEAELVSHTEATNSKGKINQVVSWKVKVSLDVPSLAAHYEGYAIGTSQQPSLGDAHDMAIKTAESDALKRCAVNLGDQFGLSLYFSKGRDTVYASVYRTLDIVTNVPAPDGGQIDLEPALPASHEDVQAIPEGLTVRPDDDDQAPSHGDVESDYLPPERMTPEEVAQELGGTVLELPADFWPRMEEIRTASSKAKRLKLASDFRQVLMADGFDKDHKVTTPSGAQITLGVAFDRAIGGE